MHQAYSGTVGSQNNRQKLCLIFLEAEFVDHAGIFEKAFRELGLDVELIRIPHVKSHDLTADRVGELKALIKSKSHERFVVFCPGLAELYLTEPARTLNFSAYRSWHDPARMRIIPHIWTTAEPGDIDALRWTQKPPLRVGFMGTAYASSSLANLVMRSPAWVKKWFLSGAYLRTPGLMARLYGLSQAFKYINTFPRFETIGALRAQSGKFGDIELDLVDRTGFGNTEAEKSAYVDHLIRNTYILCPRGSENFSFRAYETLKFGRVPVIIDTDMALPKEIDWERLAVIVPYEKLHRICDYIREDYNRRSAADFIERQRAALAAMAELQSMEWVRDVALDVAFRSQEAGASARRPIA